MIAISDLINTASQSTARYLDLLTDAGKGVQRYRATNVKPSPRSTAMIGNQCWPVILCELPKHEKFPPDSGATFVPASHPGSQIGAQILNYESRSGRAEIAVSELPADEEGSLVIDFKWLIRRCLEWLLRNGGNISNPFLLQTCPAVRTESVSRDAPPSKEQEDAIHLLLSHPVGYVWGPPGTGKTRHVLAETVGRLIRAGKRVLVAAPTNLAVDNALDAILELSCAPHHLVLRVGIPSPEFSAKWPECCEERALKDKLGALEAEAERIARRIESRHRSEELEKLIPGQQATATGLTKQMDDLESAVHALNPRISSTKELLATAATGLAQAQQQLDSQQSAVASLKLEELRIGVAALEEDQMRLVCERRSLEKGIAEIGWLTRVFTKRHWELCRKRIAVEDRIAGVEGTLKNQRLRLGDSEVEASKLKAKIATTERDIVAFNSDQERSKVELEQLVAENDLLLERLDRARRDAAGAEEMLERFREEQDALMVLGGLPDDAEIERLGAELIEVRAKMARITQDLSQKLVLGMTLDGFIGLTMNQALHFDHIVVDEAGYAPLAKVLPLLIQRCPISLLGDHLQLPPVYEGKHDVLSESYWGTSALYLEEAFQPGVGDQPQQMVERAKKDPEFQQMRQSRLTKSYRFGQELADLLDRHFYRIGLTSAATGGTSISPIDCSQTDPPRNSARQRRENPAEASRIVEKVVSWLKWPSADKGGLAILTPYRNQVALIRRFLKDLERSDEARNWNSDVWDDFRRIEVMTVNRSQGREWETVFFSASDTGRLAGNGPFLADTSCPDGKLVVNTAISHSKKHLRFFLDLQFWYERQVPSLLTESAREHARR